MASNGGGGPATLQVREARVDETGSLSLTLEDGRTAVFPDKERVMMMAIDLLRRNDPPVFHYVAATMHLAERAAAGLPPWLRSGMG